MNFTLKDYQGNKRTFSLENPETVVTIIYTVISGDEVISIMRKDQKVLETYDSRKEDDRISNFFDDMRILTLEELENLNRE